MTVAKQGSVQTLYTWIFIPVALIMEMHLKSSGNLRHFTIFSYSRYFLTKIEGHVTSINSK